MDTNPNSPHHPKYAWTYHTHFHLGACPEPYNTQASLDALIRTRVAPGFSRFSTRCSANHKGLVLLPWVAARHADYNFKDYHTYRQQQDSDLVLDIENSDLRL
ncbi:hypothetical protein [Vulcanococcus limneticus]|uniref:hypothetical protein n=1 Tax=Vulcanococcus limneticus TaxID=2170428 RepID=UPI00398C24A5